MTDSGIAGSTRSPTISEKKSALSLKFGFHNRVRNDKNVQRINSLNVSNKNSAAGGGGGGGGNQQPFTKMSSSKQLSYPQKSLLYSASNAPVIPMSRIGQPTQPIKASCKISSQQQLNVIKSRAALVLNQRSSEYRSITMRPRLSVEAIVASLEREIRDQLGPELPPLALADRAETVHPSSAPSIVDVERFGVEPIEAEVAYVESPIDDCIDNIEESLKTPSSICTTYNSQLSPGIDECPSRDDCQQADEEDSAATSISDAMIDDEIADQPGLVMLGQSASVPASPMHSWRSDLFQYAPPTMNLIYPQSEEDASDSSSYGFLRRRVASVNDIQDGVDVRESASSSTSASTAEAMRGDLYANCNWEDTVIIDLDEYNSMANELATIKSQLITLQDLLVEVVDSKEGSSPLWDLKRDLVLLREELQEKNVTIRSLKNELRANTARISTNSSGSTHSLTKYPATSCNVATQTDRPRGTPLGNGVTPADEIQLVR